MRGGKDRRFRRSNEGLNFFGVLIFWFRRVQPGGFCLPPKQAILIEMTNSNVRLEYGFSTRRANFYWRMSQTQTNSLDTGLGINWSNVIRSDTINTWTVPIDRAVPSAFFRLIHPG